MKNEKNDKNEKLIISNEEISEMSSNEKKCVTRILNVSELSISNVDVIVVVIIINSTTIIFELETTIFMIMIFIAVFLLLLLLLFINNNTLKYIVSLFSRSNDF